MRFTLKQIEYFVAAAQAGSITLASQRVGISQPSISAAISGLELDFGMQLFIRHHAQGLSLTPQGQRFLRQATALLQQAAQLRELGGELSGRVAGALPIACLVTFYPMILPELVHAFRQRFPEASVQAVAADQPDLLMRLRRGEVSLALTYDLDIPPDILFAPLAKLPPTLLLAADHPLAGRGSVALSDLAEERFLLLDLPVSRDYFLSLFHAVGLSPRIAGAFQHMDVIRSLVARGDGYSVVNMRPRNRRSLDGRELAYLDLQDEPRALSLGLAEMRDTRRTGAADAFAGLCRELVRTGCVPGMA